MTDVKHLTTAEFEAGLDAIRRSPSDHGLLELIVRRPGTGEREILDEGTLDRDQGLVGDNWKSRGGGMPGVWADPEKQLNMMNSRVAALVAVERSRWALAGDQLFVDFDLSAANVPPGTRLAVGSAVVEVTAHPHTGCQKFRSRFGIDAMNFVNSTLGRQLRLRGINARVVQAGRIRVGDAVRKLTPATGEAGVGHVPDPVQ